MIPKTLHFCFGLSKDFGGKPWSLVHYVCVKSAIERIKPEKTFLYYEFEPTGPWWNLTRQMLNPVKIVAPRSIFGRQLLHPAHRTDVIRVEKLIEHGGIYLDCDVFVHKSFDELLNHSTVMGLEQQNGMSGLCNAVILSEQNSSFLKRWHEEFRNFRSKGRDEFWNEHAVVVPHKIMKLHPDEITVLPYDYFFWPTWIPEELPLIFSSNTNNNSRGQYANHLWENMAWVYLRDLTPGRVRETDSPFATWASDMLRDLPDDYGTPSLVEKAIKRLRRAVRVSLDTLDTKKPKK